MRDISYFTKIFLATGPVDFRKQAHGLALVVEHSLNLDALSDRTLFVFTNKRKTAVKILYFDKTGYALWWKVLEKDKFRWPKNGLEGKLSMAPRELKWLLEGVDLSKIKLHKKVDFSSQFPEDRV